MEAAHITYAYENYFRFSAAILDIGGNLADMDVILDI